jgi:hypothetical protein
MSVGYPQILYIYVVPCLHIGRYTKKSVGLAVWFFSRNLSLIPVGTGTVKIFLTVKLKSLTAR